MLLLLLRVSIAYSKRVRKEMTVVKKESNSYVCGILRSASHVQEHQLT